MLVTVFERNSTSRTETNVSVISEFYCIYWHAIIERNRHLSALFILPCFSSLNSLLREFLSRQSHCYCTPYCLIACPAPSPTGRLSFGFRTPPAHRGGRSFRCFRAHYWPALVFLCFCVCVCDCDTLMGSSTNVYITNIVRSSFMRKK